jgi:hypothetical protein
MELNETQKQYYAAMSDLFMRPGWALLVKEWTKEQNALIEQSFFNAKTEIDLVEYRMRHELLSELVNLQDILEGQVEQFEQMEPEDFTNDE